MMENLIISTSNSLVLGEVLPSHWYQQGDKESVYVIGNSEESLEIARGIIHDASQDSLEGKEKMLQFDGELFCLLEDGYELDFQRCTKVLLVLDLGNEFATCSYDDVYQMCHCLRKARRRQCKISCVLICQKTRVASSKKLLLLKFPEFSMLGTNIFQVTRHNGAIEPISILLKDKVKNWLHDSDDITSKENTGNSIECNPLTLSDIAQIVRRELFHNFPEPYVFARLLVMVMIGILFVLAFLFFLVCIPMDSAIEENTRSTCNRLRRRLEQQRLSRSRWPLPEAALVLTSLQSYDIDWMFRDSSNLRSVDQLELQLLSNLGAVSSRRQISTSSLAQFVLALLTSHADPRSFYRHDLLALLEARLRAEVDAGGRMLGRKGAAWACIAIRGAGIALERELLSIIMQDDFTKSSADEAALSAIALSYHSDDALVMIALNSAYDRIEVHVNNLTVSSLYSKALILQALRCIPIYRGALSYEAQYKQLLFDCHNDVTIDNLSASAMVLLALSKRNLSNVHQFTEAYTRNRSTLEEPKMLY